MKRFDLSVYKNCVPYFYMYDVFIKEKELVKESFLIEVGVTPSSYRKCRKGELNIGDKVIEQISRHFGLIIPEQSLIDELEEFINKVYYNMYYKIYDSYDSDLEYTEKLLKSNYTIFPVIELIHLFLKISSNRNIPAIYEENEALFEKIKKYEFFINYALGELFELVLLSFEKNIPDNYWIKNYTNASAYFILSTRSFMNKRYIESLFFGSKCQEMLFKDGNVNRLVYLNYTLMSSLAHVGNYEECYELACRQFLSLKSMGIEKDFRVNGCRNYKAIALLGKKEYQKIYNEYNNRDDLTFVEEIGLLITLYIRCAELKNFDEYEKHFISLNVDELKEKQSTILKLLNQYLKYKSKSTLYKLEKYDTMEHYVKILKNIV